MEDKSNQWLAVTMPCPHCKKIITGYKRKDGSVKYECSRCKTVSISTVKKSKQQIVTFLSQKK
ncbi:MAG: hypothetical protein RR313_10245 [Anaerovoracaceae bacterium]